MRIVVLLLALLLSGCANFQWPEWIRGKADASEPRQRTPKPVAREQPAPAPAASTVETEQPPARPDPVEPSPLPRKRKYEED